MCPLADINIGGMSPLFFAGSVIVLGGGMASGELPVPKPNQPSPKGVKDVCTQCSLQVPSAHSSRCMYLGLFLTCSSLPEVLYAISRKIEFWENTRQENFLLSV